MDNLILAEKKARRHKENRKEIIEFTKHKDELLKQLQSKLINGEYHTSEYYTFTIYEPKKRIIFKLPYYPDRIVHHAIMNVLERIWVNQFIPNVYNCIKNRGIHKAASDLKKDLIIDKEGTKYCLKVDVHKFYPSIDHDVLKKIIRIKIKDKQLLNLLDEIIDSSEGVPIGNYLSQFFANLFLAYLDRDIKYGFKVYYYRYADDIVILSNSKQLLHHILKYMIIQLSIIKLQLKENYQIYPTDSRGIDFVGYVFFHTHTLLRKSIKQRMCKRILQLNKISVDYEYYRQKVCSYLGWLKYCNSYNLSNKILIYKELLAYIYKHK